MAQVAKSSSTSVHVLPPRAQGIHLTSTSAQLAIVRWHCFTGCCDPLTIWGILCIRNFALSNHLFFVPLTFQLTVFQGSDFFTIYVRPTSEPLAPVPSAEVSHDDKRLPDEIRFVKFSSISWTHDNKGFFYQVSTLGPWLCS